MNDILTQNNTDLNREILVIRKRINESVTPKQLDAYRNWLLNTLDLFERRIQYNFELISMNHDLLVSEILSETQNLTINIRALTERYLAPILRYNSKDLFCLKAIDWLHKKHVQSKEIPFAISDGSFAIFPTTETPVIYFLPSPSLNNLTHLPLIFHEFGHYLYAFHQEEMDVLVKELQTKIWNKCKPSYVGNNPRNASDIESLNQIVETWYEWMQELFCDAVGLQIGGASYLKTFSIYLRMMGRGQFRAHESELIQSSHPVTWLRIKFLIKRAHEFGLELEASTIEKVWDKIAMELNIKEEYYGFYHPSFGKDVCQTLDDMIVEAGPVLYQDFLETEENLNIINLTNLAWAKYEHTPGEYDSWERKIIEKLVFESPK